MEMLLVHYSLTVVHFLTASSHNVIYRRTSQFVPHNILPETSINIIYPKNGFRFVGDTINSDDINVDYLDKHHV